MQVSVTNLQEPLHLANHSKGGTGRKNEADFPDMYGTLPSASVALVGPGKGTFLLIWSDKENC